MNCAYQPNFRSALQIVSQTTLEKTVLQCKNQAVAYIPWGDKMDNIQNCTTWFCKLQVAVQKDLTISIVAAVIIGLILLALGAILRKFIWPVISKWASRKKNLIIENERLDRKLKRGFGAVAQADHGTHKSEGSGLWLTKPVTQTKNYRTDLIDSIPIWVIANLKGGGGKTTNATNLAAYYAMKAETDCAKPVLLIDLDYQGSASSMCVEDNQQIPGDSFNSMATDLVNGQLTAAELVQNAKPVRKNDMIDGLPLDIVPAYYDLALAENRLMIEWLFSENEKDIRYQLANILHDPLVQSKYSRIIIDAPPRLTTACIQALCASTHLLIPTILDKLSSEAVSTFIKQVKDLQKAEVCPYIKFAGVIGYRPGDTDEGRLTNAERQAIARAENTITDALRSYQESEDLYLKDAKLVYNKFLSIMCGEFYRDSKNFWKRRAHEQCIW